MLKKVPDACIVLALTVMFTQPGERRQRIRESQKQERSRRTICIETRDAHRHEELDNPDSDESPRIGGDVLPARLPEV
jgi:hypothetical protein